MRRQRGSFKLLALILGFSVLAAACGGDDDDDSSDSSSGDSDSGSSGGDLVLGAEQDGECLDWMGACGGSSWLFWTVGVNTMPRVFDIVENDGEWDYEANSMLTGEPELVTDPQQQVTYNISDEAVWSDGEPITCDDFKYTWEQVTQSEGIYDQTGYQDISEVDCSGGAKVAVVKFANSYAGWKQLFGTQFGIYPSHILQGQDRNAAMIDGYTWSAGPWMLDHWTRGEEIKLIPNENWWGDAPKLDSVTFRFITDSAAEFEAFTGGEVMGIFPQPQPDSIDQIAEGIDGALVDTQADSPSSEALWINNEKAPFDSAAVRQAFAYALDRDAIVERLFGALDITEAQQTLNQPILGDDFGDPQAFSEYTQDLDKVDELMTGDGWAKNGDGIWEKDGQPATIVFKTTAGNARRELTQDLVIEQAKEAGFNVTKDNQEAGDLFGTQLPAGDFQMGLYAQVLTSLEPSQCTLFCSANIPGPANNNSGQNWTRTNIPDADPFLAETDTNPNEDERSTAMAEADKLLAAAATSIPLDPLPNTLILSTDVKGDIINNPIWGPFFNMEGWSL